MKPIDLLLKQPEDVVDVDALFVRLLEIFSEIQVHRRQKLQRAFMDADEDGDGEMDYDEFKVLCSSVGRGIKAPLLRTMFREMTDAAELKNLPIDDVAMNGIIEEEEMEDEGSENDGDEEELH